MTAPAYTTRAEAEAPPAHLIETMARAAYEDMRPGTTLPPWERVEPSYHAEARKNQAAALLAAEAAGYRSCCEDTCPHLYGEEGCDDPACWRRCSVCRGKGYIGGEP